MALKRMDNVGDTLARLGRHGAQVVDEVVEYENLGLAEKLG